MEALWGSLVGGVVVGAFMLIVTFITWKLSSQSAREAQDRQHKYDAQLQAQQLAADRQNRQDDAIRAERRQRLRPIYDVLKDVEDWISFQVWQKVADREEELGIAEERVAEMFPESVRALAVKLVREKIRGTVPAPSSVDLFLRLGTLQLRVADDRSLFGALGSLEESIAQPDLDLDGLALAGQRLAATYHALESYIAR